MIKPHVKVLLIVSDHTRPVPNALVLRALEPYLEKSHPEILIGTGLHDPPTEIQLEEILGPFANGPYPVHIHNAKTSPLVSFGRTSSGTLIEVNALAKAFDQAVAHCP